MVGHKNRQISKLEKSHKNQLYKVDLQKWKFPIKLKIQCTHNYYKKINDQRRIYRVEKRFNFPSYNDGCEIIL